MFVAEREDSAWVEGMFHFNTIRIKVIVGRGDLYWNHLHLFVSLLVWAIASETLNLYILTKLGVLSSSSRSGCLEESLDCYPSSRLQ